MRRGLLGFGLLLGTAGVLSGCESDPAGNGTARVAVHLTDAPGDLVSAEVEVREIYLQGGSDEGEGRVVLYTGSRVVDLLELQNGVTAELSEATVPAGNYSQLRMVIGDATITTEGGATYSTTDGTLLCPSCAQSGLKINLPGGAMRLEEGEQSLIVDFDVAQSFGHQAGNSGRWVMHPVIAATSAEVAASIVGDVALAVDLALPFCGDGDVDLTTFVPTFTAGDVSISGRTEADGSFRSSYVAPGTYTVGFESSVEFGNGDFLVYVAQPTADQVTVTAGQTATVDYNVISATCTLGD